MAQYPTGQSNLGQNVEPVVNLISVGYHHTPAPKLGQEAGK